MIGRMLVHLTEHLLQTKDEDNTSLSIDENRCVRTRHQKASCQKCQEVCPQQAFSFRPAPHIDHALCIDCGLCQLSCPTGAITWKVFPEHQKNHLLQQSLEKARVHQQPLTLMCERTPKAHRHNETVIPCLGHIKAHDLAYLVENAPAGVKLISADCAHCPHLPLLSHLETTIKTIVQNIPPDFPPEQSLSFMSFLPASLPTSSLPTPPRSNDAVKANTPSHDTSPQKVMDRRAFFKEIRLKAQHVIKEVAIEETQSFLQEVGLTHSNQAQSTHTALTKLNAPHLQPKAISPHTFTWMVKDTCLHCHVCALVCPVHAITHQDNTLQFDMTQCLDCGLCQDVCFRDALVRMPVFP